MNKASAEKSDRHLPWIAGGVLVVIQLASALSTSPVTSAIGSARVTTYSAAAPLSPSQALAELEAARRGDGAPALANGETGTRAMKRVRNIASRTTH